MTMFKLMVMIDCDICGDSFRRVGVSTDRGPHAWQYLTGILEGDAQSHGWDLYREGKIREVCGTVHYLQPGLSSLISRGLVDLKQVAEAELKRNDPTAHDLQLKAGYITGIEEARPAVITVNMFIGSLAVLCFAK